MKVLELLERRRKHWQELEALCDRVQDRSNVHPSQYQEMGRFATLYRAACADLALADSYQLPQNTVQYLHRLVGRARNQLYRSKRMNYSLWAKAVLEDLPQLIFNDRCIQFMFVLFWGAFIGAALLAANNKVWPTFAEDVVGQEQLDQLKKMYAEPIGQGGIDGADRSGDMKAFMASHYIRHNTGIGLQCFSMGILVIPGLCIALFNALSLGACFGYMARPEMLNNEGQNFFHFVTAHGPFELTAIVLSAGAGLRLGVSWIMPGGLSRMASLQMNARKMAPVVPTIMVMFFMAALIEGFISPSNLPYAVKVAVALISSAMLMFYFVILGMPRGVNHATR